MILDFHRFLAEERPHWEKLEALLDQLQRDHWHGLDLAEARRLHYLYERAGADLAKLAHFTGELELREYLEALVARAYGEIHGTQGRRLSVHPMRWFTEDFPQVFRRHIRAFGLAVALTVVGAAFGGAALTLDPAAKSALMPFGHLVESPEKRVRREESNGALGDRLAGQKGQFAATLMTHNTRVSIFTVALGTTWGIGTVIILFYNGIILGAVAADYLLAGQSAFLVGWLLPHGSVEIPAILIAGQAGLVLAKALIGWGRPISLHDRLRAIYPEVTTLVGGVAVLLVWAGIVEAFFSQYHEPALPYSIKIVFGLVELGALFGFLYFAGRNAPLEGGP